MKNGEQSMAVWRYLHRRRQIHLPTAIALMGMASLLLWANFGPMPGYEVGEIAPPAAFAEPGMEFKLKQVEPGWPWPIQYVEHVYYFGPHEPPLNVNYSWYNITWNVVAALSILLIVLLFSEYMIRLGKYGAHKS